MAAGTKIADFFAKVGFQVDTKDLKNLDKHLKSVQKSFNKVGTTIQRTGKKIDEVFSGLTLERRKFGIQKKIDLLKTLGAEVTAFKRKLAPSSKKSTLDKLNLDLDKAIHKQKQLNSANKASREVKSSAGGFTAAGFMSKESNIRNVMGLSPKEQAAVERYARMLEKSDMSQARANATLKEAIARRKRFNRQLANTKNKLEELNFVQSRVISSTKQLVSGFVGAFAAVQVITSIKNVGQELEGARASMLATSRDSLDLQKSLAFVDKQAVRLGLDLAESTKSFIKLKAVSKEMKDEDLQQIFLGVAEAGTVLQLSQDDMKGALKAKICMAY